MRSISIVEISSLRKSSKADSSIQIFGLIFILLIVLSSFIFLFINVFRLTIVEGAEYAELSEYNTIGKEPIWGERGIIFDRNKEPLVANSKVYEVYVNPQLVEKSIASKYVPGYDSKLDKIYKDPEYVDYLLAHNVSKEIVVKIKEDDPEGIKVRYNYSRKYLYPKEFAHILGYIGIASMEDLESDPSIMRNQIIGKTGLEFQYEEQIKGELKYLTFERDALGNEIASNYTLPPAQGDNLILTISLKYQKAMYGALSKAVKDRNAKGASGVIINVNSGEILALANYPSYNNNLFVNGISYENYSKLVNNPQTPLLFRAIAAQEPPGSTFKTIVATAALETRAITESTVINAPGVISLQGGYQFQDYHKHYYGNLTVREALMVSSNIFFCKATLRKNLQIDNLDLYAEAFGIGSKLGIDLPGEMPGRIPSPENKFDLFNAGATWLDDVWYPEGDTCNSAIGQGITLATPLQMASVAATIANNGTLYKPYIVNQIGEGESEFKRQPQVLNDQIASENTLKIVREGMRMSVKEDRGVATALRYVPVSVAAKTGTAEFGVKDKHGYSTAHGWVIGFWPYNEPKYAFAILIEGAGTSSAATFAMQDFLNRIY